MPYIQYEYDPNDPQKTAKNRANAYGILLGGVIIFNISILGLIYFISSIVSMFKHFDVLNAGKALLVVFGVAIIDTFILMIIAKTRIDASLFFFLFGAMFLYTSGGALVVTEIIGFLIALNGTVAPEFGDSFLLWCCISIIVTAIVIFLIWAKISGTRLFSEKSQNKPVYTICNTVEGEKATAIEQNNLLFCHRCGKKIEDDSVFCSACGTKLK